MSEHQDQAIEETDIVLYGVEAGVATITMNRPKYNNAQNGRMTYELDDAFKRAVADDEVKVIVLKGEGKPRYRHAGSRCTSLSRQGFALV